MKRFVDLHTHTTASDGTESPTQVVSKAHALGLVGVAITDHDTIQGVEEGLRVGTNLGIEVVGGVEISCNWETHHIHLLGLYIDTEDSELRSLLEWMRIGREQRLPRMIAKLRELGIEVDQHEVEKEAGGESSGRPHLARVLLRHNHVTSIEQAFDKYLGYGRPAYVDRPRPTISQGIQAILHAKGVPVVAHPLTVDVEPKELISDLVSLRLQGIEYFYPYEQVAGKPQGWYANIEPNLADLMKLAKEYNLILTGGSDYHGFAPNKADLGSIPVPVETLEMLRRRYKDLYGLLPSPRGPA
jgi:predicted metal-dependent phosphoesterase TrpH